MPVGKPETHYTIKALDNIRTAVTKFEDDNYAGVYTQERQARCDCTGCIVHRTQCKHLRIRAMWESQGRPFGNFTVNKKGEVTFHKYQGEE